MMSSTLLAAPPSSPRLLDQVRERIRVKHYSLRTEQAYLGWIKRYIFFHDKRHPRDMGKAEVEAFLGALAVERNVSAATQTQALSALLFLYREVLGIELPWLDDLDVILPAWLLQGRWAGSTYFLRQGSHAIPGVGLCAAIIWMNGGSRGRSRRQARGGESA